MCSRAGKGAQQGEGAGAAVRCERQVAPSQYRPAEEACIVLVSNDCCISGLRVDVLSEPGCRLGLKAESQLLRSKERFAPKRTVRKLFVLR